MQPWDKRDKWQKEKKKKNILKYMYDDTPVVTL